MLSVRMLEDMPCGCQFATGEAVDEEGGLFLANTGKELRWVAIRGHGPLDWAIYAHEAHQSLDWIARSGDKVHFPEHIQKLVPCDEETLKLYRN